jgi:hypothetical protein
VDGDLGLRDTGQRGDERDELDGPHERDDDERVARGGAGSLVGLRGERFVSGTSAAFHG